MKLFPAKPRKPAVASRQILQASVVRRSARAASIEEEEEPTTSFTTALVVVVILHLVAAGGVYMFESIKTHHPNAFEGTRASAVAKTATPGTPAVAAPVAAAPAAPKTAPAAVEPVKKPATASTTSASTELKDSGTTYTVVKGDNPVNISRRLRVSQEDLLKLNRIDDPKKLRIGLKLRVPAKLHAASN